MKRRDFINIGIKVLPVIVLGGVAFQFFYEDEKGTSRYLMLDEFMPNADLNEIIQSYIENDELLLPETSANTIELFNTIKEQYKNGETIICGGWILTPTELEYLIAKLNH